MKYKVYYIKAYFGKWHEVSKEYADEFIKNFYSQSNRRKSFEEFKAAHYKVVEEEDDTYYDYFISCYDDNYNCSNKNYICFDNDGTFRVSEYHNDGHFFKIS